MAQTISSPLDAIIGHSGVIKTFKQQIELVAKVDSCVLITGETGTGKDLAALTIHKLSSRACKPFININCAAFPEHLIQSELFGHEKGAFTGAVNQHIGKIEQAEGGTLFLNEIGDLPISLQAVLLKFLDDQCIERIGGTKCFRIDCRIIAATHVDLTTKIEQNLFRDDLYYRLNTLPLYAPPLRKRKNDIVLLGQKFCDDIARENGTPVKTLSLNQDAINYSWPGNIRELKSYVIRTALLNDTDTLKSFFHENLSTNKKHKQTESIKPVHDCKRTGNSIKTRSGIDKKTLIDAIKVNHYNISATARSLNISRTTCYRLMKKCNIKIS
ncbi:sigma-54 interaction domain-containing protein [Thalassotalea litorea]|uniref:sigma-54 interaction domain-containing protein n=1 Tax=Thalassotalea litorea TaxID=2020715 RepID=UPI003736C813